MIKGDLTKLAANVNASSILRASKAQNKYLIKEPEWDSIGDNVRMRKVINDRNCDEVVKRQEKMCEQTKIKGKQNLKRIEEVRKTQADIRQIFIETNNFINDCEAKCTVIDKKIDDELNAQEKLQKEIDDMEERIRKLTKFHDEEFQPAIKEMSVYEDILQEVVDEMDIFKSKEDFLDRCNALLLVRNEVTECDEISLKAIEEMQADLVKTSNEMTSMMAGFENEINKYETMYKKMKDECLKWEGVLAPTKEVIADKEKETFMIMDQIQQMYLLLCKRNGVEPKFKREQIGEQLDYIKREIEIITEIIDLAKEMTSLETRSDIAEDGSGISGKPRK